MITSSPRKLSTLNTPAASSAVLHTAATLNRITSKQVCYRSSLRYQHTVAVSPSNEGSRAPCRFIQSMNSLCTKGSVVANIESCRQSTTCPGMPACRHSINEKHCRPRPEPRQNQKQKKTRRKITIKLEIIWFVESHQSGHRGLSM